MSGRKIKDVVGAIKRITEARSKEFHSSKGPFTIWSIGVLMDNGDWYNIKANDKAKAESYLVCDAWKRNYKVNDEVKLFLEAEDDEAKYWRIVSIVPHSPTDDVKVEMVGEPEEPKEKEPKPTEEELEEATKEADKKFNVKPLESPKKEEPKKTELTPEQTKRLETEADKVTKTVKDFKGSEADKYELGMAKNNAAIIFAAMLDVSGVKNTKEAQEWLKAESEYYDKLVIALYEKGRLLRRQLLGY